MNIKIKFICVMLLAIASCNTDDTLLEPQPLVKSAEKADVFVERGILNIKDESEFWKLVELNSKKTYYELKNWQDSLGFESFFSVYESIFSKYEKIVEGKNPIEELEQFRIEYKDFVIMATGTYDGLPDYSIKPAIDMLYASVANANGLVKIGGKLIMQKVFQD